MSASVGSTIYGIDPSRIEKLKELFSKYFETSMPQEGDDEPYVCVTAPGRVELAGNHVDHQGGQVLAAAINLRAVGLARKNSKSRIRIWMDGFGGAEIDVSEPGWTSPRDNEYGTSQSMIRGMAASFVLDGGQIEGFDMVTVSDIPTGGGLSSSAAFEVLVGLAIETLFGNPRHEGDIILPKDTTSLALDAVKTEREYFGKPCGALDQLACATGGAIDLDFSVERPVIKPVSFNEEAAGYAICLIDSLSDHAKYTEDYASVPADMFRAAKFLGAERLCEVDKATFFDNLAEVRNELGDRVALRALHYYDEVDRVQAQSEALDAGDFETFIKNVKNSGASSAEFLQNVTPAIKEARDEQPAMMILALSSHLLGTQGAWRIHGGGFGGSVLVIVPKNDLAQFMDAMNSFLGYAACLPVKVSELGVYAGYVS